MWISRTHFLNDYLKYSPLYFHWFLMHLSMIVFYYSLSSAFGYQVLLGFKNIIPQSYFHVNSIFLHKFKKRSPEFYAEILVVRVQAQCFKNIICPVLKSNCENKRLSLILSRFNITEFYWIISFNASLQGKIFFLFYISNLIYWPKNCSDNNTKKTEEYWMVIWSCRGRNSR